MILSRKSMKWAIQDKYLPQVKFECEGGPKHDIGICIDVDAVTVHCGEERAQCKSEAVSFPVHLCSYVYQLS